MRKPFEKGDAAASPRGTSSDAAAGSRRARNESGVHARVENVLLIAQEGDTARALGAALARRGYPPVGARTVAEAVVRLAANDARLVVLVLPLSDASGREAIDRIRDVDDGLPLVVVGVDETLPNAGEAFDLGAEEHLLEADANPAELLATIGVVLGSRRGDRHFQYLRAKEAPAEGWHAIIGESPALERVVTMLKRVCSRTSHGGTPTILLNGETGTGKGFVARCIHYNGIRRNRPFVEVNCAALPPTLMESELFGHERGSFTDAKTARAGLFETADGGTLFLDEIGALPLDLQAKLLTAIEDKRVRRIGARQAITVDVQIISATHDDLARRATNETFRQDLFHRLNVVSVTLPALRDRGADVVKIGEAFLRSLCVEYGMPPRTVADDAKKWMMAYAWPGNVRELRNQIERIVLLENDDVVRAAHFAGAGGDSTVRVSAPPGSSSLRVSLPPSGIPLEALEREVIKESLARCDGNVSHAARYLSISRQTLIYRMKKYGLGR